MHFMAHSRQACVAKALRGAWTEHEQEKSPWRDVTHDDLINSQWQLRHAQIGVTTRRENVALYRVCYWYCLDRPFVYIKIGTLEHTCVYWYMLYQMTAVTSWAQNKVYQTIKRALFHIPKVTFGFLSDYFRKCLWEHSYALDSKTIITQAII